MPDNRSTEGAGAVRPRLVDRRVLAFTTGYTVAAIRKHLTPVDYDPGTGAALYDPDQALAQLEAAGVEPRPDRRGPRRHAHDARVGRIA